MNALVNTNIQTMTSLEIAELVDSRHDKVKQSIERLVERGVITKPPMGDGIKTPNGVIPKLYIFSGEQGKRDSIIVVAQLCPEFTARLVDRWQELESLIAKPIDPMVALSDPNALRGLLLGYSEKVIELESKVEEMAPTVEAYDRLAKADGSMCLTDAAKALQIRPKDLISNLQSEKWIYKRTGSVNWLGYQDRVQSGYLEHKVTEVTRGDGTTKITEQVRVTPKGLAKLAKEFGNK
jgi:phage antirepressor YoqD-like protein